MVELDSREGGTAGVALAGLDLVHGLILSCSGLTLHRAQKLFQPTTRAPSIRAGQMPFKPETRSLWMGSFGYILRTRKRPVPSPFSGPRVTMSPGLMSFFMVLSYLVQG